MIYHALLLVWPITTYEHGLYHALIAACEYMVHLTFLYTWYIPYNTEESTPRAGDTILAFKNITTGCAVVGVCGN